MRAISLQYGVAASLLPAHLSERTRDVAAIAGPSQRAAMHVVLLVTSVAVLGQRNLGDILRDVARVAIEAAMGPGQRKVRLGVVVKAP